MERELAEYAHKAELAEEVPRLKGRIEESQVRSQEMEAEVVLLEGELASAEEELERIWGERDEALPFKSWVPSLWSLCLSTPLILSL